MNKKRMGLPAKGLWVPSLLVAVLLSGCSEEVNKALAATSPSDVLPGEYAENAHVTDDRKLNAVGDTVTDEKGTLTLAAINTEPVCKSIGPLTLTIHESKLMHYRPDYSLIDFYRSYTQGSEFHLVKLTVALTNLSDEPMKFGPASTALTSGGELKTLEDDVYLEELNGMIAAGETKTGSLGFIVENAGFETVVITTSDLLDQQDELITPAEIISIDLLVE